ncbi:hypothetical protein DFW101_2689 [Solidesulfovibrio carbinoliphilus subsp. oakridgensis]|uniref:Uncharacterized protein n=1 Tax=Solidesulfovibrio carbinoliphilus subsp. oakridgensis TaxID=694327 RepID=G7QAE0_9BACT|nr:hypothetical protein [Solidesulfovibrio carbinoliphilus]EHJ48693.1 hypothetical protein DFW101_2689 [Solidesulfovibrio carbinoliphilus subsp. oakridgensis]
MSEGVIDLKRQLRELKAHEQLAGFAGFGLDLGRGGPPRDGVMKIAEFVRQDGTGYVTLTFQVDADPDPGNRAALSAVFDRFARFAQAADAATGQARFGSGFEYLMVVTEGLADGDDWLLVEFDIYYKNLKGRLRGLIEASVLPGLAPVLPATFEPVTWWEPDAAG